MNHPQGSARATHPLRALFALLALTAVCFAVRSVINSSFFTGSNQRDVRESPHITYGRLLGRYQKLQYLLERIEQSEDSTERLERTVEYNRLAQEYNELMESLAFPFTQRSHVPPGSPGPLARYVSLLEQR